jgi:hypothetical protein
MSNGTGENILHGLPLRDTPLQGLPEGPPLQGLSNDTFHHILSFLDDVALAESVHVSHTFFTRICTYLRLPPPLGRRGAQPFRNNCSTCLHPPPYCECRRRNVWYATGFYLIIFGLILFCFLYPLYYR